MTLAERIQKNHTESLRRALECGRKLAYCEPGDQVVISGIAGAFPESDDVGEFGANLLAKTDLTTEDERRSKYENILLPQRIGKMRKMHKFDASFFGASWEKAESMDPQARMVIERTFEAIIDSGYNPKELRGSNIGVFVGVSGVESNLSLSFCDELHGNPHSLIGIITSMFANRVSHLLDLNGASYSLDANNSSSTYAFERAYNAISSGQFNGAIVAGCNICFYPLVAEHMRTIGLLGSEGRCKCFDKSADGYGRSESIVVAFLQRKKNARRMYARVVHTKVAFDGYKPEGPHHPSMQSQRTLLEQFYKECQISPLQLDFVECHGAGSKIGDYAELNLLENVFLKGRNKPLNIGSAKSNMGHSESAAALCSIVKVILSYEKGVILPNLNFPNFPPYAESLRNGKLKLVTEPTPWSGGLTAINNFGFGGTACHILLDSNPKTKKNYGLPDDDLPRLVLTSGRTVEAVDTILGNLESQPIDAEYVGLLHEVHKHDIPDHIYRGFTVLQKDKKDRIRDIRYFSGVPNPIWFIYPGIGSQWVTMGKALMKLPIFAESIQKCHNALLAKDKDMDLIRIITENDETIFRDNMVNAFVGIIAIDIALTDLLASIGITPNGFLGHSIGELGCAYADGCLNAEQAILLAYYRGIALISCQLCKEKQGLMAVVGLELEEVTKILPPELDIACHNSLQNYTVSGPEGIVEPFIQSLQKRGVYARSFKSFHVAAHSRYLQDIGPMFLEFAKSIIKEPKLRSNKWVTTTFLEADWSTDESKYYTAEYLTTNVLGPVYFEEATRLIPENATVIEIAPHGVLQTILTRSLSKTIVNVPLMYRQHENNLIHFLCAVGRIYESGETSQISKLYPPIEFPVSKGTPMLSPLIKWDHKQDWFVGNFEKYMETVRGKRTIIVSLRDQKHEYLGGHILNGEIVYPAAGHLINVWETYCLLMGKSYLNVPVVFRNVRFFRNTIFPDDDALKFLIVVHKNNSVFKLMENNDLIVTGQISEFEFANNEEYVKTQIVEKEDCIPLTSEDVYREFRVRGHNYRGLFQGITQLNLNGTINSVSWYDNFICFLDSIFQIQALDDDRCVTTPSSIQNLVIDPQKHFHILTTLNNKKPEFCAYFNKDLNKIQCGGIQMEYCRYSKTGLSRTLSNNYVIENTQFVPYINPEIPSMKDALKVCAQILKENSLTSDIQAIELVDSFANTDDILISQMLFEFLREMPETEAKLEILISDNGSALEPDELKALSVKRGELPCDRSCSLVIISKIINRPEVLKKCLNSLNRQGFLLVIEMAGKSLPSIEFKLDVCFDCIVDEIRILLLRKITDIPEPLLVKMTSDSYSWVRDVQKVLRSNANVSLVLYAEKDPLNGLLGLFYCLKKEVQNKHIRCFFILDGVAPAFSIRNSFYQSQLIKNVAVNVYKNGKWGSYRHLQFESTNNIRAMHAYVNSSIPGNLTTLRWIEGPLNPFDWRPDSANKILVHVYYAALNSRDVVLASGKMALNEFFNNRIEKESTQGIEFAGKTEDGRRFMGAVRSKAIANVVECDASTLLPVPDNWTLEDAATVYFAYTKVLQALFIYGHLMPGMSVLIHSGASDIGLAAITICLHYGCTIFTTVESLEKEELLKKIFSSLPESHIGNAGNKSFLQLVLNVTNGEGVNLLLTSLSKDNLLSSTDFMAPDGRILEIGKFDDLIDSLDMKVCAKDIGFHAIGIDFPTSKKIIAKLNSLMEKFIKEGVIKPLPRTVFGVNEIRPAYRYLASGRPTGKVMIKIRAEEANAGAKPTPLPLSAAPRYSCRPDRSYIICDGLGKFSLELADWLVVRGARNLVLTTKSGVTTGYEAFRIKSWQSYGANITIVDDATTEDTIKKLLESTNASNPVSAIFFPTPVFENDVFEKESSESFAAGAKATTKIVFAFDKLSRKLCPRLESFVVFTSLSSTAGNRQQTKYALCNSSVERICELRKMDNLPALAIEWGAFSEVNGYIDVLKNQDSSGDSSEQEMRSCIELLDQFLKPQNTMCVVRGTYLAEQHSSEVGKGGSVVDYIARILGLPDLKTVSLKSTLADKGFDSLMISEIRQSLENNFNIVLKQSEIGNMSFAQLLEIDRSLKKRK